MSESKDDRTRWFLCGQVAHGFRDGRAMCGSMANQPGEDKEVVFIGKSWRREVGKTGKTVNQVTGRHWNQIVCVGCKYEVVKFWCERSKIEPPMSVRDQNNLLTKGPKNG